MANSVCHDWSRSGQEDPEMALFHVGLEHSCANISFWMNCPLALSPGWHSQCQHVFWSRDVITVQTAASPEGCSSSFSLGLLSLVLSFCPCKTQTGEITSKE